MLICCAFTSAASLPVRSTGNAFISPLVTSPLITNCGRLKACVASFKANGLLADNLTACVSWFAFRSNLTALTLTCWLSPDNPSSLRSLSILRVAPFNEAEKLMVSALVFLSVTFNLGAVSVSLNVSLPSLPSSTLYNPSSSSCPVFLSKFTRSNLVFTCKSKTGVVLCKRELKSICPVLCAVMVSPNKDRSLNITCWPDCWSRYLMLLLAILNWARWKSEPADAVSAAWFAPVASVGALSSGCFLLPAKSAKLNCPDLSLIRLIVAPWISTSLIMNFFDNNGQNCIVTRASDTWANRASVLCSDKLTSDNVRPGLGNSDKLMGPLNFNVRCFSALTHASNLGFSELASKVAVI